MVPHRSGHRKFFRTVLLGVCMLVATPPAQAILIDWDGNQTVDGNYDGEFDVANNWNPDQIPAAGHMANFNVGATYTVTFTADEEADELRVVAGEVTFLSDSNTVRAFDVISGNMDGNVSGGSVNIGSSTNPVVVNIGDIMNIGSNVTGENTVTVSGAMSALNATAATVHNVGRNGRSGQLFVTDNATVTYGGTLRIGVDNNSVGLASVDFGGVLNTGSIEVATVGSNGSGTLQVSVAGSSINQNIAGATLTVGSAVGKPGTINIGSEGVFSTGTGITTINATGTVNVGFVDGDAGTLNVGGDLLVDGGTVQVLNDGSDLNLAAGTTATFQNGGQWMIDLGDDFYHVYQANSITLDDEGTHLEFSGHRFRLHGDSTMNVTGGADVLIHTNFDVGNGVGKGTLMVSGAGTTFVAEPDGIPMWWGRGISDATVTFTDEAVGSFLGGVDIGNFSSAVALTTVSAGAHVTFGPLDLADGLVTDTGEATLIVTDTDTMVLIDGASGLSVGKAEGGIAQIQVTSEAVLQMGTGETLVGATGSINVADATFNTDGNVNLVGGSMTADDGSIITVGGQFVLSAGGTLTIDRGRVNANSGLDATGGTLNLDHGVLSVTGGALMVNETLPTHVNVIDGAVAGTSYLTLGEGATANLSRPLHVGVNHLGSLTVNDGGNLTSLSARVAIESGSTGFTRVSGTDSMGNPSTWTITGNGFSIGEEGSGYLTIEDGGHVSSGAASIATVDSNVTSGIVTVSGTDEAGNPSSWTSSSTLSIGSAGEGRLTIEGGGHVSSVSGSIGTATTGEGTVIVRGTDQSDAPSQWIISDFLAVGSSGTGELEILDGGKVVNLNAFIGASALGNGTVTVSGSGSNWTSLEELAVGGDNLLPRGSGHLRIADEGLVQVDGTLRIWSSGVVMLDGGTLRVDSNGVVVFGTGNLNYLSGTFHLIDAGGYAVGANSGPIDQVLGYEHVSIPNGGGLIVDEQLSVPTATSITAVAGAITADSLTNDGLVNLHQSTLTTTTGVANSADMVLIDSTIESLVNNANGSTVTVLGTVDFNGLVSGPGNFFGPGTANFNGGMAPGASPGEVSFEGSVSLAETNTLYIEIGGTTRGDEYDSLTIAGTAQLDGLLSVSLVGFTPEIGQEFTILSASNIADNGMTLGGPAANSFILLVNSTTVILQAIVPALPGDYNSDGIVNLADYTVWRDNLGAPEGTLANDPNTGAIGLAQYATWKANFGATLTPSGSLADATVPEPSGVALLSSGCLLALVILRRLGA